MPADASGRVTSSPIATSLARTSRSPPKESGARRWKKCNRYFYNYFFECSQRVLHVPALLSSGPSGRVGTATPLPPEKGNFGSIRYTVDTVVLYGCRARLF